MRLRTFSTRSVPIFIPNSSNPSSTTSVHPQTRVSQIRRSHQQITCLLQTPQLTLLTPQFSTPPTFRSPAKSLSVQQLIPLLLLTAAVGILAPYPFPELVPNRIEESDAGDSDADGRLEADVEETEPDEPTVIPGNLQHSGSFSKETRRRSRRKIKGVQCYKE